MKRYLSFLLLPLLMGLLLSACKLSISGFAAPDTTETGTVIRVNLSGYAEDIGDNATEHGVILQIPQNWQVISAKAQVDSFVYKLSEQPAYELLYTAESGYRVWVGTSSTTGSGDRTVTATIKVLTGDFDGNVGDTRTYTLKVAAGAYRDDAWVTDDPEGEFDFSNITEEKYVESIIVTKVEDNDPPDPLSTLKAEDLLTGSNIRLDWSGYDEDAQGDVVNYRIYQSTFYFEDVSGMTPIDTVPAGTFTYQVSGLTEGVEYFFAVTAVDEVPNENKGVIPVSIVPTRGGSITGIVTDEDGAPIPNLWVEAYDHSTGDWVSNGQTQADGSYAISCLYTGTYRVYADAWGTDYISEYYDDKLNYEDADPVSVTQGQETTGIDFQLALGGKIKGVVTDGSNNPIEGLLVYAYDYHTQYWVKDVQTASDGSYAITGLPTGTYAVYIYGNGTYISEYYDDELIWPNADPVDVIAGQETSGIDFQLALGGKIEGIVTDINGHSLEGLWVYAYDYHTRYVVEYGWTEADGSYSIGGLYTGTYGVYVYGGGDYHSEYYDDKDTWQKADPVSVTAPQIISGINFELSIRFHADYDNDGDVDGSDLATFADAYAAGDSKADLNGDGKVNGEDLAIFASEFGKTSSTISSEAGTGIIFGPEWQRGKAQ